MVNLYGKPFFLIYLLSRHFKTNLFRYLQDLESHHVVCQWSYRSRSEKQSLTQDGSREYLLLNGLRLVSSSNRLLPLLAGPMDDYLLQILSHRTPSTIIYDISVKHELTFYISSIAGQFTFVLLCSTFVILRVKPLVLPRRLCSHVVVVVGLVCFDDL